MAKQPTITYLLIALAFTTLSLRVSNGALFTVSVTPYTPAGLTGYTGYTFHVTPMMDMVNPVTSVEGHFVSLSGMYQLNPDNGGTPLDTVDIQNNTTLINLTDANGPQQDSQFNIDLSGISEPVRAEDATSLSAATFRLTTPLSALGFSIAHVVIPDGAAGTWSIKITQNFVEQADAGTFGAVPEASQVLIGIVATVGVVGVYIRHRFFKDRVMT